MKLKEFIENFIPDSRTFVRLIHAVSVPINDKYEMRYERIPLKSINGEVKTMATAELIMFDDYYNKYHDRSVRGLIDSCSPIEEVDVNAINIIIDD